MVVARRTRKPTPGPVELTYASEWVDPTSHRSMAAGDEFRTTALRGRWRFVRAVTNVRTGLVWLDVQGPVGRRTSVRSIDPSTVTRIHRTRTETR